MSRPKKIHEPLGVEFGEALVRIADGEKPSRKKVSVYSLKPSQIMKINEYETDDYGLIHFLVETKIAPVIVKHLNSKGIAAGSEEAITGHSDISVDIPIDKLLLALEDFHP